MIFFSEAALARRSKVFRYVHFLITGVRYKSFARWSEEGQPNPFVTPNYHHRKSRPVQISEFLMDFRVEPSRDAT